MFLVECGIQSKLSKVPVRTCPKRLPWLSVKTGPLSPMTTTAIVLEVFNLNEGWDATIGMILCSDIVLLAIRIDVFRGRFGKPELRI